MLLEASEAPCCPPACLPASHGLSPSPSPGIRSQTPLAACLPACRPVASSALSSFCRKWHPGTAWLKPSHEPRGRAPRRCPSPRLK